MLRFFDCNGIADKYFSYVEKEIKGLGRTPKVKLFLAGESLENICYSKIMAKEFEGIGIKSVLVKVDSPNELERMILSTENEKEITGCFVFYPINFPRVKDSYFMRQVPQFKDIEGLSSKNVYRLIHYYKTFDDSPCKAVVPCTPKAVIKVLTDSNVEIQGKDIVIINRSYLLGIPLQMMFNNLMATVATCDINTKHSSVYHYLKNADIVVTAVPTAERLFDDSHLKKGASLIDCSFYGNFDFNKVSKVAKNISCRQAGNYVGPVTTAMAAVNILYLLKHQIYFEEKNKSANRV